MATKKTAAAENTNTGLSTAAQYDWTKQRLNEDTGELETVQRFKYVPGAPREYRCDAKNGQFTVGGQSIGKTLKIKPLAFRFFNDDILGQGPKFWAEVFFIDAKDCVSRILFHGSSAQELQRISEPLFYDEKSLTDVEIDIYFTDHVNKKTTPASKYCIAHFDKYEFADEELVKEQKAYAKAHKIYAQSTWTPKAEIMFSKFYYNMAEPVEVEEDGTSAEVADDDSQMPF